MGVSNEKRCKDVWLHLLKGGKGGTKKIESKSLRTINSKTYKLQKYNE